MAKINLLPWRVERRAQRQKEFYAMLGLAAAAGVLLSFLIWFHYNQQIDGQNERNQFLQAEIAKVEEQIVQIEALDRQRDRLLARKEVIEQLQANRSQMVHLFDSLVRTIPDGVALTAIKQEGEVLTLEGRSQSNARVSTYMRNLEGSGWMTNPELSIIEATAEGGPNVAPVTGGESRALPFAFALQVKLANPNATTDADGMPLTGVDQGPGTSALAPSDPAGGPAAPGVEPPAVTPAGDPVPPTPVEETPPAAAPVTPGSNEA